MVLPTWLVLVIGVLSYFLLPFSIWCIKNKGVRTALTILFFVMYLGVLFCGVFGKLSIAEDKIVVKFDFSGEWFAKTINWSLNRIGTFDLVINLVMLFPIGMLIVYFARKRKWWVKLILLIVLGFLSGAFIETCQFVLPIPRGVQLSDALLNMTSTFAGGMIAWIYIAIIQKWNRKL